MDAAPNLIRSFAVNKSPALLAVHAPSATQLQRAAIIADAPELRMRVGQALAARFCEDPTAPPHPVEKQIYQGFYSNADKALLTEFQRADWARRQEIVATLSDVHLRQLGRRLVAFHAPQLLSGQERGQYEAWLQHRWIAADAPENEWTTIAKASHALGKVVAKIWTSC